MKPIFNKWHSLMCDTVMKLRPSLDKCWCYDYGVVFKGFEAVWRQTGDLKYFDYIKNSVDALVTDSGEIKGYNPREYNIDHVNNGKALLFLFNETKNAKYKAAADLLMEQLKNHPRTSEGIFWHKQIYPNQVWLDGIYMGSPFYAQYAAMFDLPESVFDDICKQPILCYTHNCDPSTGLLYHAWDESGQMFWVNPENNCSHNFWGRAMGWYCCALVDLLDYIPENHGRRKTIIDILNRCVDALLKVRDEASGVWYQVLNEHDRPGNYLEASASCMNLYAIARGIKEGYLPKNLTETARDIYKGVITQFIEVTNEGMVNLNKVCQVAGLGPNKSRRRDGSFAYYISEAIICNDLKGIGIFIQMASVIETLY